MFAMAKYVVGIPRCSGSRKTQAVVLPKEMNHCDVMDVFLDNSITSAGFFNFDKAGVYVSGVSTTLNKQSQPSDEAMVGAAIAHPAYSAMALCSA